MNELTKRQQDLLAAIIEQHAEVAAPVGSVTLAKAFGVSSATIRSEMAMLERLGFIKQPHTSAGRVPTDRGYRYYVNQLRASEDDTVETIGRKLTRNESVIDRRISHAGEQEQAVKSAVESLAEVTRNVGFAMMGNRQYISGLSRLFNQPEFVESESVQQVAYLLDNLDNWLRETKPSEALKVYIGSENPVGASSGCSLVISRFASPFSDHSYVGILGPTRQNYREVMSVVKHAGKLLERTL